MPFLLIAGGEDAEAGAVSFRFRDGSQDNGVPVAEAVERIVDAVRTGPARRTEGQSVQETTGAGPEYPGDDAVTDDFGLAGVPDAFQRLWTPHRMAYIQGGQHQPGPGDCPFCVAPERDDEEALIVHRGRTATWC